MQPSRWIPSEHGIPSTKGTLVDGRRIAVIDYGMGNRRSVVKALEHVGADVSLTGDLGSIADADGVVVPGVGAFGAAMSGLRAAGLDRGDRRRRRARRAPVLGICLGMQVLFERSYEHGVHDGLGLIGGEVARRSHPAPCGFRTSVGTR